MLRSNANANMFHGSGAPLAVKIALYIVRVADRHNFDGAGPRRSFMLNRMFISNQPNHNVEPSGMSYDIALWYCGDQ